MPALQEARSGFSEDGGYETCPKRQPIFVMDSTSLKVVYCLTSHGDALYETMTRLSLASVRLTNPSARVEVLCDHLTFRSLRASKSFLLNEVDELISFTTPNGTPAFRSRFVKTCARLIIDGPFLFLDSDTVVRKSLSKLLELNTDIALAPNHSSDSFAEQIWERDQLLIDEMGWKIHAPYMNSGVIWYSDSPAARRVSKRWNELWRAHFEKTGNFRDQPALNCTLSNEVGVRVTTLGHDWNTQYKKNSDIAQRAKIWHSYSSAGSYQRELFFISCTKVRVDRPIQPDSDLVRRLVAARTPILTRTSPLIWQQCAATSWKRLRKTLKHGIRLPDI